MKVRIVSPGWETFTGPLGQNAWFKDGESVDELTLRQVARIGSSLQIVDIETGLQVGPSVIAASMKFNSAPVAEVTVTQDQVDSQDEIDRGLALKEDEIRLEAEEVALEAARVKAAADAKAVVYSRQELEAIASNDGVEGLRTIATPLGIKGRSITDLVTGILTAQAENAVA